MTDEQQPTCTCPPDVRVLPPIQHEANCPLFRSACKARMAAQDPRRAEGKRPPRERKPL